MLSYLLLLQKSIYYFYNGFDLLLQQIIFLLLLARTLFTSWLSLSQNLNYEENKYLTEANNVVGQSDLETQKRNGC